MDPSWDIEKFYSLDLSRPVSTELSKYYWKHVEDDLHDSLLFYVGISTIYVTICYALFRI